MKRKIFSVLFALLLAATLLTPTPVAAAEPPIAVNAVTTASGQTASITFSHTVSGNNRLLVVSVQLDDGAADKNVSAITYAGQSLTSIADVVHSAGSPRVRVYRLVAPPAGTANVVVTLMQSNKAAAEAISYKNVDQVTPIDGVTSATGTSTTPSVSVTSAAGDLVQDSMASIAAGSPTVGAGQTQRWNLEIGGTGQTDHYAAGSTEPGAASVTMSWTISVSGQWVIVGFNINPLSWESYKDAAHTTVWGTVADPYAGPTNTQTVYMYGSGFTADHAYHVGYYDDGDYLGGAKHGYRWQSHAVTSGADGSISSQYALNSYTSAIAGTWHAVVFDDSLGSPELYYSDITSSTVGYVVEDSFQVEPSAIPEFPTIFAAMAVAGLCFGIYYWMRKRRVYRVYRVLELWCL